MSKQRFHVTFGALAAMVCLGATERAEAVIQDRVFSPALFARYPNYTPPAWADPDQAAFGPSCTNNSGSMPNGRQVDCNTNTFENTSTGVYRIKVTNGSPLPASNQDAGWALFVTPVGSNARCAETTTSWANYELSSTIKCVNPSGNAVNTQFVWVYRTDSGAYMQFGTYARDFAYARVNRGAGNQVVGNQTFTPFGGSITSEKLATGKFRVTFQEMNQWSSFGFINAATGLNNVVVQRTCANDTSAECLRAVCVPTAWSFPAQVGTHTTVDVECHYGSTLIDVDFRVFIGNQAVTSQMMEDTWTGGHYAWAKSPYFAQNNVCKQTDQFTHRNMHEPPDDYDPTMPATACRSAVGTYRLELPTQGFYSFNRASALVTSRSTGNYCNADYILCGGQQCNPTAEIGVRCYDNTTGNAKDGAWNLSVTY